METKINPNQINSKPIKILNVIQTGTLTRNEGKFGGFSSSNYLSIGKPTEILSLDSGNVAKKDITPLTQADDWEFVVKFKTPNDFHKSEQYYGWEIWQYQSNYWEQYIASSKKINTYIDRQDKIGDTVLVENTIYYVKTTFSYSQSTYKVYLSTTGEFAGEETLEASFDNIQKRIPFYYLSQTIVFGYNSDTRYAYSTTVGYLDMEGTYIKINGEYWWQGVETL